MVSLTAQPLSLAPPTHTMGYIHTATVQHQSSTPENPSSTGGASKRAWRSKRTLRAGKNTSGLTAQLAASPVAELKGAEGNGQFHAILAASATASPAAWPAGAQEAVSVTWQLPPDWCEAVLQAHQDLLPDEQEKQMRKHVLQQVDSVVRQLANNSGNSVLPCSLGIYGSYVSGMFNCSSDLDLTIVPLDPAARAQLGMDSPEARKALSAYHQALKRRAVTTHPLSEMRMKARVPLVVFAHKTSGLRCDLTFNNLQGIFKAVLLQGIRRLDERFTQLYMLVKAWARNHRLNEPADGTFNSWCLALLVVHYLQVQSPAILPPLRELFHSREQAQALVANPDDAAAMAAHQQLVEQHVGCGKKNTTQVGELLVGFLERMDWLVSMWYTCTGTTQTRVNTWGGVLCGGRWTKPYRMSVEDPLDPNDNCARTIGLDGEPTVHAAMAATRRALQLLRTTQDGPVALGMLLGGRNAPAQPMSPQSPYHMPHMSHMHHMPHMFHGTSPGATPPSATPPGHNHLMALIQQAMRPLNAHPPPAGPPPPGFLPHPPLSAFHQQAAAASAAAMTAMAPFNHPGTAAAAAATAAAAMSPMTSMNLSAMSTATSWAAASMPSAGSLPPTGSMLPAPGTFHAALPTAHSMLSDASMPTAHSMLSNGSITTAHSMLSNGSMPTAHSMLSNGSLPPSSSLLTEGGGTLDGSGPAGDTAATPNSLAGDTAATPLNALGGAGPVEHEADGAPPSPSHSARSSSSSGAAADAAAAAAAAAAAGKALAGMGGSGDGDGDRDGKDLSLEELAALCTPGPRAAGAALARGAGETGESRRREREGAKARGAGAASEGVPATTPREFAGAAEEMPATPTSGQALLDDSISKMKNLLFGHHAYHPATGAPPRAGAGTASTASSADPRHGHASPGSSPSGGGISPGASTGPLQFSPHSSSHDHYHTPQHGSPEHLEQFAAQQAQAALMGISPAYSQQQPWAASPEMHLFPSPGFAPAVFSPPVFSAPGYGPPGFMAPGFVPAPAVGFGHFSPPGFTSPLMVQQAGWSSGPEGEA